MKVNGVVTQGRNDRNQWVTSYQVSTSVDGDNWKNVGTYTGNKDRSTKVKSMFPSPESARCVRISALTWRGHLSMRAAALTCAPGSCSTLNKPENQRTYSSVWGNNKIGTGHARSALDSVQAWSSKGNSKGQWMQMDLGSTMKVSGVVTQGRKNWNQWVTSYQVATSIDGKSWKSVGGTYTGNGDRSSKVKGMFPSPVSARYVRISAVTWLGHISMRAAAIACSGSSGSCSGSTLNKPENKRTYSSVWGNSKIGTGHARSALDSVQAWSSKGNYKGQWMQIDLGLTMTVVGVVTQGRNDRNQWVTSYQVATSVDSKSWKSLGGTYTGNRDRSSKVKGLFPSSVLAALTQATGT